MPIYVYEPLEGCKICGGEFEVTQSIQDQPLSRCPKCDKPCQRVIRSFSCTSQGRLGFDLTKAKSQGFQVLKKRDKGVYEKL